MGIANLGSLPLDHTVLLYCSPTKFEKNDDGYIAPSTDAFRRDDDGNSVTWVEYFKPPPPSLDQAKEATAAEGLTIKKSGVFAKATVSRILELAAGQDLDVSVVHDPLEKNQGHSLIKGWPIDDAIRLILTKAFPPPAEAVRG